LFLSGFPTKLHYAFLTSRCVLPHHSVCFIYGNNMNLLVMSFSSSSFLLGPVILITRVPTSSIRVLPLERKTKFHTHTTLCFSIRVRDQVSHPYKTVDNVMVLNILSLKKPIINHPSTPADNALWIKHDLPVYLPVCGGMTLSWTLPADQC
jgi:hypothetical protein